MARQETITTERLVLRPLEMADAQIICKLADDLEVARWLTNMPHPYRPEDAVEFISQQRSNNGHVWAITFENQPVGIIGHVRELGYWLYWLGRDYWGHGYATEAGMAFLAAIDARFGALDITASCFDDNPASKRVLNKLGFVKTGESTAKAKARLEPSAVSHYRRDNGTGAESR